MRERTIRRRQAREAKAPLRPQNSRLVLTAGVLLLITTVALYLPVRGHSFVYFDDNVYVIDNPRVNAGLSWSTLWWSLTSTEHSNWHPVTWLSHALDCEIFGLDAGAHHLINVAIHSINSLLLFLILQQITAVLGRSFLVAALFAFHPLNVETVAWIAERKSLLSMFFFLLALLAYVWYARAPGWRRMTVVGLAFVLALASKPMAVTVPFVLQLLDYWPLRRIAGTSPNSRSAIPQWPVSRLFLEKLPLFFLSALSCAVTVYAQGRAVRSLQQYSLVVRLQNALYSYAIYLEKTFWPHSLAVFYPFEPGAGAISTLVIALLVMVGVSIVVWNQRRRRPFLIVGCLWFMGTLVPMIGVVQVGDQAMADRYAYLPLIGLFIAVVWLAADVCDLRGIRPAPRWAIATAVLVLLSFVTERQIGYWENDVTLWSHAEQVTPLNDTAEGQLAAAFLFRRDNDSALPHLLNVTKLDPADISAYGSIGAGYLLAGRVEEAIQEFDTVVRLSDHPNLSARDQNLRALALVNLGFAAVLSNDYTNALNHFEQAESVDSAIVDQAIQQVEYSIRAGPTGRDYLELPLLLRAKGKDQQALNVLAGAIRANPEYEDVRLLWNFLTTDQAATVSDR